MHMIQWWTSSLVCISVSLAIPNKYQQIIIQLESNILNQYHQPLPTGSPVCSGLLQRCKVLRLDLPSTCLQRFKVAPRTSRSLWLGCRPWRWKTRYHFHIEETDLWFFMIYFMKLSWMYCMHYIIYITGHCCFMIHDDHLKMWHKTGHRHHSWLAGHWLLRGLIGLDDGRHRWRERRLHLQRWKRKALLETWTTWEHLTILKAKPVENKNWILGWF